MTLECENEIFQMAKQMVKERQDITGLNCIKEHQGKGLQMIKGSKTRGRSTWRN